ncbi:MAG: hypothetical protein IJZ09_01800 [Tidjanibacter sp.]|nr:hypothetical protein [Tidjanibacter sp.]
MKKDIRKFLGKKLCEYNNEMQGSHTLHQLLEDICSSHSIISMSQNNKVLSVYSPKAHEAYHVIVDSIWHIKLFEEEKIIQFYKQAAPQKEFKDISTELDGKVMGDCVKIPGDVAEYISNHDNLCIWIHPDIESLVKNNFVKAELAEAKRQTKWAIVAVIISIFALLASIITPFYLDDTTCDAAVVEAYAPITPFYEYSTVQWEHMDWLHYRPNVADWGETIGSRISPDFPMEIAVEYWDKLQKTKTYFHQQTLPLRCNASKSIVEALNQTESQFDSIFVKCVGQEYYMRLFPEVYNEVMQPAIDNLCETIRNSQ